MQLGTTLRNGRGEQAGAVHRLRLQLGVAARTLGWLSSITCVVCFYTVHFHPVPVNVSGEESGEKSKCIDFLSPKEDPGLIVAFASVSPLLPVLLDIFFMPSQGDWDKGRGLLCSDALSTELSP